jgi:hypothetical protein
LIALRHVGPDEVGGQSFGSQLLNELVAQLLAPTRGDYACAFTGEKNGSGTADPRCRPGDDRDLAGDPPGSRRVLAHAGTAQGGMSFVMTTTDSVSRVVS